MPVLFAFENIFFYSCILRLSQIASGINPKEYKHKNSETPQRRASVTEEWQRNANNGR